MVSSSPSSIQRYGVFAYDDERRMVVMMGEIAVENLAG
jgi:hypothetical protein